jgi:hypothetical protein
MGAQARPGIDFDLTPQPVQVGLDHVHPDAASRYDDAKRLTEITTEVLAQDKAAVEEKVNTQRDLSIVLLCQCFLMGGAVMLVTQSITKPLTKVVHHLTRFPKEISPATRYPNSARAAMRLACWLEPSSR